MVRPPKTSAALRQLFSDRIIVVGGRGAVDNAVYAGNNMRLHSPNAQRNVELAPMYTTGLMPYGGRVF